jgi:hypothetical protein
VPKLNVEIPTAKAKVMLNTKQKRTSGLKADFKKLALFL